MRAFGQWVSLPERRGCGILAGLPPHQRRLVHEVVASSAVEGPSLESAARLADLAAGKITGDQYRAEIYARLRAQQQ